MPSVAPSVRIHALVVSAARRRPGPNSCSADRSDASYAPMMEMSDDGAVRPHVRVSSCIMSVMLMSGEVRAHFAGRRREPGKRSAPCDRLGRSDTSASGLFSALCFVKLPLAEILCSLPSARAFQRPTIAAVPMLGSASSESPYGLRGPHSRPSIGNLQNGEQGRQSGRRPPSGPKQRAVRQRGNLISEVEVYREGARGFVR